jgi:hypothetical protein
MPSPFPGMDPYLEDPDLWPDVHARLIGEVQADLNRQIAPNYVARVEQRVFISDENDPARDLIVPDVRVVRSDRQVAVPSMTAAQQPADDAVESFEVTTETDEEIFESFVRVYDRRDRSIITLIEVLSPANKTSGSAGRRAYREKRQEVLASPAHFVEIDLLRAGTRSFVLEQLPAYDYLVHVSRAVHDGGRRRARVWPIPITRRLPVVPVPLRHGDADAQLDLQHILAAAYDHARYDLDVDYAADPVPPVDVDRADWVRATARAATVA